MKDLRVGQEIEFDIGEDGYKPGTFFSARMKLPGQPKTGRIKGLINHIQLPFGKACVDVTHDDCERSQYIVPFSNIIST